MTAATTKITISRELPDNSVRREITRNGVLVGFCCPVWHPVDKSTTWHVENVIGHVYKRTSFVRIRKLFV